MSEPEWTTVVDGEGVVAGLAFDPARVDPADGDPTRREEMAASVRAALSACLASGGSVSVPAGTLVPGRRYEDALARCAEFFAPLARDAEDFGVTLLIAADGFPASPVELRDLVDRLCSGMVLVDLNVNTFRFVDDWILTLGPRLGRVRGALDESARAALTAIGFAGARVSGSDASASGYPTAATASARSMVPS